MSTQAPWRWLLTYSRRSWAVLVRLGCVRLNAKAGAVHAENKDTAQFMWETRTGGGATPVHVCGNAQCSCQPVQKNPRLFMLSLPPCRRACSLFRTNTCDGSWTRRHCNLQLILNEQVLSQHTQKHTAHS